MLLCYLRVCPFTKAIGQDCTIEKREDQCCPVITCPEVEVQLLDHQTTANPSNALGATSSSEVGAPDQYGCSINGRFYPEGAQVPSNPQKPCELCYCIRNMTTCVMQECTLHIDGCQPIYNKGVCCLLKYDCDHDKDSTPMLEDEGTTTVRPTPGFILTTTVSPSVSTDCVHNGETYADGALITTDKPCEHCYCMRGDIVCAVQECGTPLENEGKNCTALPPAAAATMVTTTPIISPTANDDDGQEQEKEQPQYEDSQPATPQEQAPEAAQTTAPSAESTTLATMDQKVQDVVTAEQADSEDDDDQQEQQHVVPQFEDVQTDDSHEEDDSDVQVPEKVDDEQPLTTAHPTVSEEPGVESDHIPGHEGSHEEDENQQQEATTAVAFDDVPALTTVRSEVQSNTDAAAQDETSTEPQDDSEVPSDTVATTVAPTKDAQEPEADDDLPVTLDADEATSTEKPTADEIVPSYEPTTVRNEEDSFEHVVTTSLPALAIADEKENEIDEHHDQVTETNTVEHQSEHDDAVSTEEHDEQKEQDGQEELEDSQETGTTTAQPERDEVSSEPEAQTHAPSSAAIVPEQDKPDVSNEKKEAAQKADDQPQLQPEQDFVELPPAVVVTELPPLPTSADEMLPAEQTPEPPKDEILVNIPLEADSHVLSDSMTTEHAPTFGDRKEDDVQEPEQIHVHHGADMDEPVEMNTVIPLEQDEQKVDQPAHEDSELAHDKEPEQDENDEHSEPAEEDGQSGETQGHDHAPVEDEVQTPATPLDEKLDDDLHVESPDKLFPESIPGEGDCLIDGVTYENGATVPTTGKCQVACHCSNSIVHCEMVRCQAPPSDDCTPKSTVSGECCPTYSCPKETTSTASSVSVESTEASTESDDVDSDEEQQSADVSAESSESSTKAPVSDSQSTSTNEEDDESSQPSEAESDSAGFDLDDDVFKPLRPQEPSLDMSINYFAGNRPTTANYDDDIILSTAAPTNVPASVDSVKESAAQQVTEVQQQEKHTPTEATPSADSVSDSEQKEESTTTGDVVERGPEVEQDQTEENQKQDEEPQPTTAKAIAGESQTTNVPISESEESSTGETIHVDVADDGAEIVDHDQFFTTPAADVAEEDNAQTQGITVSADNLDKQQDLEQTVTTAIPVQAEKEIERDDEQESPVQTTVRSVEPTLEVTTKYEPEEHQSNDIESDEVADTVSDNDKPLSSTDDEDTTAQEATTTRHTETAAEQVTETQHKLDDATTAANILAEHEENRVGEATTTPTAALNEPENVEQSDVKQTDESDLTEDEVTDIPAVSTSKPVMEIEQTTSFVQDVEAGHKMTTLKEEEQPLTTAQPAGDEKESDEPASATVATAMDKDNENNFKTTEAPVTQKTTNAPKTNDDALIFRVDDDEEQPIVKPTLEESVPTQDTVKPTFEEIKPSHDAVKPKPVDREETDDDNLISPEQDGGFHFPQEDDDEAEEPIFKPSLDHTEQHETMPLPVEIPQETLEPVDQIKEHDESAQTTTVPSERVTAIPSTVGPLQPDQDREQITHDDDQESNEIEADVQQITVPVKKPEQTPIYDEIEENEQQTVKPTKHTPEQTTTGYDKTHDSELQSTTVKYDVSDDAQDKTGNEREQSTTATQSSSAFDVTPAIEQHQEQDETEKDDGADAVPDTDNTYSTTVRVSEADSAQDEEQNASTAAPTVAQEQDKLTTPPVLTSDDSQSEEKEDTPHIQLADDDEDVQQIATTPQVSVKPESADENDLEQEQVAQSDDQEEDDQFEDATTKDTGANDEVQTTTADVDVKQTPSSVFMEQPSTLAPMKQAEQEDQQTQKPEFDEGIAHSSVEENDEQESTEQQTETTPKVPVAHAAPDTSEELVSATEPATGDVDSSSSTTEASLKESEEDQKLDDGSQDEQIQTTVAPQATQDKKQQPDPELDVTTTPADSEHAAPMEDDVDFEQEQQTITSTTAPQAISEKDKQTTTDMSLDDDKLAEPLDTQSEKVTESPEQDIQATTARATEFDFNVADTYHEHPIFEPESDDDAQDEVAHSTTFATPEQPSPAQDTPHKPAVEEDAGAGESTDDLSTVSYDESVKPETDLHDDHDAQDVRVTTGASVDDEDSAEEDDDVQITTVRQKPISEDKRPSSTTAATVPKEPEQDQTDEEIRPIGTEEPEQTSESVTAIVPESDDKLQPSEPATDKPTAAHDVAVEAGTTSEEEQDDVEQPQTDDLHADDDSSEEEDTPVTLTTTSAPVKATTTVDAVTTPTKETAAEEVTSKIEVYTTVVPGSDSQVNEQQTVQQEDEPISTAAPVTTTTIISQQAEDASQATSTTVLAQNTETEHSEAPSVPLEAVTMSSTSPALPTADVTTEEPVREVSKTPVAEISQDDISQTTIAPLPAQDDKLEDKIDTTEDKPKPSVSASDEEMAQKPQPAGDESDEQQVAAKPTFTEDEDDDQQKVQEPEITGLHDDSSSSAKPTQQPETVGPSYGAPGQHYDSGYGHMPPHYPPSSYEDDYGEEEDPAAFGPGTCRYGGKLYVSAQQIPRDDPCDFCFCFRSDIICLQQSCPPPISGCNEEPIAGFCCPRYECPVSMATVLNVTTSTTTTTTTLPPHFLSHAYKGHVQKRGCQIQGKPYNVGETVASASGPCMRCTCGGDGQMQCEPKACSPEPMLQQMIAVAAAKRR
uniref:VWFC domain-containing protein n=1 Tax=Anopheles maculatus TaxID=74869 RepID=A0A182T9K6_9DIPT